MKMKAKREEVYSLELGGLKLSGLRVKSRWNGLADLRDEKGQQIIVTGLDGGLADAFDRLLGEPRDREVEVIQASPDLVHAILAEEKKQETPT